MLSPSVRRGGPDGAKGIRGCRDGSQTGRMINPRGMALVQESEIYAYKN